MRAPRFASYLLLVGATAAIAREFPMADGGKGKKTLYGATVPCTNRPTDSLELSTEIEHVMFRLNSVNSKYKVVRIKIKNHCDRDLLLDVAADKLEFQLEDGLATGFLDLAQQDPGLWNNLEDDLRRDLLYPRRVEKGEEENVFVFLAQPRLARVPRGFRYSVRTLGTPIDIRDLTPIMAK